MLSVSFFAGLKESGYIIYKTRACERGQEFVSEPCWVPIFQSALFRHRGGLGLCLLWRRVWSRDAMAPPPPPRLCPRQECCACTSSATWEPLPKTGLSTTARQFRGGRALESLRVGLSPQLGPASGILAYGGISFLTAFKEKHLLNSLTMEKRLANAFQKGSDGKYFRLCHQ